MTNEEKLELLELIAQARELCEQQIADYTPRESWTVENYPIYWLAEYQKTLKAWTTHLAEMDEHGSVADNNCKWCSAQNDWEYERAYPCDFLVTKAKRLLGVE